MTSLPDGRRPASTWIVVGIVAVLAVVVTLLTIDLLNHRPSGTSPSPSIGAGASATLDSSARPIASSSASSGPSGQNGKAWTAAGAMLEARSGARATLLLDGTARESGTPDRAAAPMR